MTWFSSKRANPVRVASGFLLGVLVWAGGMSAGLAQANPDALSALDKIKAKGVLTVAVYKDNPPFSEQAGEVDVSLAQLLADELGVKLSLMPFDAGENMGDDLRNMVWKGHYLGYGPADVMLHVPVDKPLMQDQPKVHIFGPYYRSSIMLARNVERFPQLNSLASLKGQSIAVPGQTLAGWLMLGADNGAYRDQLITKLNNGMDAARLLQKGEVAAAVGEAAELQAVLGNDPHFAIEALPIPRAPRDGWVIGMAVKKEATDLARALQEALNHLAQDGRLAKAFNDAQVLWRAP
jgi:ABC-type amino acid transport substrate-binding protein